MGNKSAPSFGILFEFAGSICLVGWWAGEDTIHKQNERADPSKVAREQWLVL